MLVELIENGIEAEKHKQQQFFALAEQFRNAADPEEAKRLGDALGRMVFGSATQRSKAARSQCASLAPAS